MTLADKMRALANEGHAQAIALRINAEALDNASVRAGLDPSKVRYETMIRTWTKARRLFDECTGRERFL